MTTQKVDLPLLIGLSGPIGCGKSTVARVLADLGGAVIDADQLARRATEHGAPALSRIRERFGDAVFTPVGSLDRAALAGVVFNDAAALRDLEAIVHPEVRRMVDEQLAEAARDRVPFVAVEAIRLVEGGLADRCDEVWLIDCTPDTQRRRLRDRGMDESDVEQRIAAQGEGLTDRLAAQLGRRVPVRRVVNEGPPQQIRELVEDALAEALAPPVQGDLGRSHGE